MSKKIMPYLHMLLLLALSTVVVSVLVLPPVVNLGVSEWPTEIGNYSTGCTNPKDRAQPWSNHILTSVDAKEGFTFLAVKYPLRDPEIAQTILLSTFPQGTSVAGIRKEFSAYKVIDNKIQIRNFTELIQSIFNGWRYDHDVFIMPYDEGCGNLTIWRVEFVSSSNKLNRVIVRRVFDDIDFYKRGLIFNVDYFDQGMHCQRCLQNAFASTVFQSQLGTTPLTRLQETLRSIGAEEDNTRSHKLNGRYSFFSEKTSGLFLRPFYLTVAADQETGSVRSIGLQWTVPSLPFFQTGVINQPQRR